MEFGMSRRIKPKEKYVRISIWTVRRKIKNLWSYVVGRKLLAAISCSTFYMHHPMAFVTPDVEY